MPEDTNAYEHIILTAGFLLVAGLWYIINNSKNKMNMAAKTPPGHAGCGIHNKDTATENYRPATNTVKTLTAVSAVQDEAGHWYVIPADLHEEFSKLHELACDYSNDQVQEQAETEFLDKFNQYRTGGDLNNVQLYADLSVKG